MIACRRINPVRGPWLLRPTAPQRPLPSSGRLNLHRFPLLAHETSAGQQQRRRAATAAGQRRRSRRGRGPSRPPARRRGPVRRSSQSPSRLLARSSVAGSPPRAVSGDRGAEALAGCGPAAGPNNSCVTHCRRLSLVLLLRPLAYWA